MIQQDSNESVCCLTVNELAKHWRCRASTIRAMIHRGALPAIQISGTVRITPKAIRDAERGPLAVRPRRRRKREQIDPEIAEIMGPP
jgi:excisionase family DNA binding protein